MSLSLSNDAKNSLSITNESKTAPGETWNDATFTWDEAEGTWDLYMNIDKESKNSLTINNEAKS